MKIISLLSIWMVFIVSGIYIKLRIKKRVYSLEKCILFLDNIETEINYLSEETDKIVNRIAENIDLSFLKQLKNSKSELSLGEEWKNAVESSSFSDALKKDDVNILISFGKIFGLTDTEGQINNCRLHRELIQNQLNSAREEEKRKAKLIPMLSFLGGLCFVVMFV